MSKLEISEREWEYLKLTYKGIQMVIDIIIVDGKVIKDRSFAK